MSLIDIEGISTCGWEAAIRGMRNSRQSWNKSDSEYGTYSDFRLGPNDLELASKLARLGSSHAKFRRMIHVQMDICAPIYWWKEYDTYKIGTVANSNSTMYSIAEKEFKLDDFAVDKRSLSAAAGHLWMENIRELNMIRESYLATNNHEDLPLKFARWRELIQLLPCSYKQLRTVDLNYEVLSKIVYERKNHKLPEWNIFCTKMRVLPYAEELIFCDDKEESDDQAES